MSLSTRRVKEANLSAEVVLDDMLARAFERLSKPRPAQFEKYDILRGILPTYVVESNIAINSLIFVADARFQHDNADKEEDYHSWAGVLRDRFYRKNGQIERVFSLEHAELQDFIARDVKGEIAKVNPDIELVGPEYAMHVVAGELVLPNSIDAPIAQVMQLHAGSREVA